MRRFPSQHRMQHSRIAPLGKRLDILALWAKAQVGDAGRQYSDEFRITVAAQHITHSFFTRADESTQDHVALHNVSIFQDPMQTRTGKNDLHHGFPVTISHRYTSARAPVPNDGIFNIFTNRKRYLSPCLR